MSFNDGFSIRAIPFVLPLPNTASLLISNPGGTGWIAGGIIDNAISASVFVIETVETAGNIAGNGAPEDPVVLKDNISLISVTASFNGDLVGTASFATNSTSASFATNSTSASFATNSTSASFATSAATASYVATGSAIATFTNDVRAQLTGSQYVNYDKATGVTSLPFTGSTIGTTAVILGQTTTALTGLTSISSSLGLFQQLTVSNLSASNMYVGNLIESGSGVQAITAPTYQIIPASSLIKISASANYVMNSSPTVKISGFSEGLKIWIVNVGSGIITFKDETKTAGTKLRLGAQKDCALNEWGSLQLILTSGSTGLCWVEVSRGA